MYLVARPRRRDAAGRCAARAPADAARLPVGALRAQPRRADARQALGERARRGVRRVRAGAGPADVRPRPAPPAARDAGRRRAPDAARLLAHVLAPGHAGAVLRRGDRDGGEPGDRRPLRGARADAVVRRSPWRLHDRRRARAPAGRRRAVRLSRGQRRRAAPRPELVPELDGAPDPAPARVPRAGLGRLVAARAGRSRGVRAPRRLGRLDRRRRAQPRRPRDGGRAGPGRGRDAGRPASATTSCRSTARCGSRSNRTISAGSASAGRDSASRRRRPLRPRAACR